MKVRCKREAKNNKGDKVMKFTKGNIYEVNKTTEEYYEIEDDNGKVEGFFELGIMFEKLK